MKWSILSAVVAVLTLAAPAAAAPTAPLFASDELLRVTIKAPFGTLVRAAPDEEPKVAGTLAAAGETLDVTLSPRGITRRQKDVCSFPPLRVEFTAKPGTASLFKGQKKLKLVTHCRPADGFQQYLLLEYAAYRLYNRLTPQSFLVRLATIDYVDDRGRPLTTRLGFFIEDTDGVAKRNGLDEVKAPDRIPITSLATRDAVRFALFEVMIGNLDWAMNGAPKGENCCHNSRLIAAKGATGGYVPVPYDFDFSGLVDTPYAVPPNAIPLPNVRVRRYRGYCRHNAEVPAGLAELAGQRAALVATLSEVPQLDARSRSKAVSYLDSFFKSVDEPEGLARLLKTCV